MKKALTPILAVVAVIAIGVRESDAQKPKRKTPEEITRFF